MYQYVEDPVNKGVFKKDPTLKTFLKSGPAIAATLSFIRGHMHKKTEAACRRSIEDYVDGREGGVTRRILRFA